MQYISCVHAWSQGSACVEVDKKTGERTVFTLKNCGLCDHNWRMDQPEPTIITGRVVELMEEPKNPRL